MADPKEIKEFLAIDFSYGDGSGDGSGSGYGYGFSGGSGDGYGDGDGSGYGDGSGSGDGYGSGYGCGYGSGRGCGYGDGYGSGRGCGYGDGYGDGDGDGDGIKSFCSANVYDIDSIPTILDNIKGNFAQGRILRTDFTTEPCWVAKGGGYFAHGDTIHGAYDALQAKILEKSPLEERIAKFNEAFPDDSAEYPAAEFFRWHHVITGSCETGRREFCQEKGVDLENGSYTVEDFCEMTSDSYGGEAIAELAKSRGINLSNPKKMKS